MPKTGIPDSQIISWLKTPDGGYRVRTTKGWLPRTSTFTRDQLADNLDPEKEILQLDQHLPSDR